MAISDEKGDQPYWNKHRLDPYSSATRMSMIAAPLMIAVAVLLLVAVSICEVYSATIAAHGYRFMKMQCIWVALGIVVCVVASALPLDRLFDWSRLWMLLVSLPLFYLAVAQACVKLHRSWISFFPFATEINGAVRWLKFGSVQVQPSEFAKIALVIFLSAYYGRISRKEIAGFVKGALIPGVMAGGVLALMFLGRDLSTTVITGVMVMAIMFMAGMNWKYVCCVVVLAGVCIAAGILFNPERMSRITSFNDPENSYQLMRSQVCLATGGLAGSGYGQGYLKSYLPENHTDFIIAVVGEEFGFLGLLGLGACYVAICIGILLIARECRSRSDMLLCLGVAVLIIAQAETNIGVVTGGCPPTGLTAPFLSYGGSSMVSMFFLVGLVFNVLFRNHLAMSRELAERHRIPGSAATEGATDGK